MITEFGAEANRSGPVTEKGTYEFQADFLKYHLDVFASKPFISGALIWNLRDFRVKPGWAGGNPLPHPPVNEKGLVDDHGRTEAGLRRVRDDLPRDRAVPVGARPRVASAQRLRQSFADSLPAARAQRLAQRSSGASASCSSAPVL